MLTLTGRAQNAANKQVKEPNIVLEIEGLSTIFGAKVVQSDLLVGDDDFYIGEDEDGQGVPVIGGLDEVEDQNNAIIMDATTTQISQLLQIDLGQGGSITNLAIALMDGDGAITKLITPGAESGFTDILQTRCKVYLGFADTAWPTDYVVIFRGVVSDVTSDAGKVILTINHPDDKKQGSTFKVAKPKLNGAINNSQNTIVVDDPTDLLVPVTGPDGSIDSSYECCVIIDSEIIKYTGISGATLTGCVRGYLFTTAASHADQADVSAMHRLVGNCVDLALKIMASTGDGEDYLDGLAATSFVDVDGSPVANSIYFKTIDVVDKYNVQVGDWITTSGASNGANNQASYKQIIDIVETDNGTYLVIDGVTFVSELATSAVVNFRSQYDTLPDGLGLINDEIDFDEHVRLQNLFLGLYNYDFQLKADIADTRKFIEQQIYSPVACFSLPKKSRCSIGYHIGPIPGQDIKIFDQTNIKDPSKVTLKRTTNRYFYNEILYQFDEDALTPDQYNSAFIDLAEDSKAQIKKTDKTLIIQAKGLRSSVVLSGATAQTIAKNQSNKRLTWYKFAAEMLSFSTLFVDGFNVEIGDIVWIDGSQLQIPDIKTGKKGMAGRYFYVINKKLNIKNGDVQFDCLDTNFANNGRYGLISPSSIISAAASKTEFTIQPSFSQKQGTAEHKKWTSLIGATVKIRSTDFSISALTTLVDVSSNLIVVSPALPWVPSIGYVMELPKYTEQALASANLVYVSMSNTVFPDGKKQFVML